MTGVLICGSHVTGHPTKHSDIDLQIILEKKLKWRERGNSIVDGFLIEYFANPPIQILKYFQHDYHSRSKINSHMFTTGKIILDEKGEVHKLVALAKKWERKKFRKPAKGSKEFAKYHLWDMLDNLEEIHEAKGSDFAYTYYNFLNATFEFYSAQLGYYSISAHKLKRFLTNRQDQLKYKVENFPDRIFTRLFVQAFQLTDTKIMLSRFRKIVRHIHKKLGGFDIDGWKVKSPIES